MGAEEKNYNIHIISGTANVPLAQAIADHLKIPLEERVIQPFQDGEISIKVVNNVRGADMFIIQPCCRPNVNDNLIELCLLINTLKLASTKRINVVMPYYPYGRQDRKTEARVPISASLVAQLVETCGIHRVIALDLHCGQIQGFFREVPVDHLFAEQEMAKWVKSKNFDLSHLFIVSPDAGGVTRAQKAADLVGAAGVVTILKRRVKANQVQSMQIVGDVKDADCVLVDDMIDTAGTLAKAAALLKEKGARSIRAFATHGLFSGSALQVISESELDEVCVTDSIPQHNNLPLCPKLCVASVVGLLAEAICRVHNEESLACLFQLKKTEKSP